MKPAQLVTLAALRDDLPPPNSAAPATAAPPALVASADQAPTAAVALPAAAAALPLPPPVAPTRVALTGSPVRSAKPAGHSVLHLANGKAAENLPPPRMIYPQSSPAVSPQFVDMKAAPASIDSGSVLGMAADLAPPRPLPQGIGN
jgi:hypothetical protein